MLDYVFFHEEPADQFVDFLKQLNVDTNIQIEDEIYEISIPEDIEDALLSEIDTTYDRLLDLNRALVDKEEKQNENDYGNASVVVNLSDGSYSYADVNPAHLNKILQVITPDEFGNIVNAIADAVENPQQHSYCQRKRDQET